jgi:hypothetical protein
MPTLRSDMRTNKRSELLVSALLTGTVAGIVSTAALAALAKAESKHMARPMNSTSHWLNGDNAGEHERVDFAHTAIGFATHQASSAFWALPFEAWLVADPPRTSMGLFRNAAISNRCYHRLRNPAKTTDAGMGAVVIKSVDRRIREFACRACRGSVGLEPSLRPEEQTNWEKFSEPHIGITCFDDTTGLRRFEG